LPVIVACGRLTAQKNHPLLLNSMALVLKQTDARLLILGKGEKKDELEKLTQSLGIEKKVFFLGFKKNHHKYIARSSIFVLSSDWEGFSSVIMEAMACGVSVISTRCPSGPDEIITDGVNGLLVPVGDADAMAGAILRLLKDETLRKKLADAGRSRSEDFRVEKMVAGYEKVFGEAAGGS
jgi:glycosyltransferase involved in cell wall biosynthesis